MGKLGEAVVEIYPDLKPLDAGLSQAEHRISGFASGAKGLVAGLGVGAGALGLAGVGAALVDSARKAADLGESLSKTRTTFGKDSARIEGLADDMAAKFGLVKKETIDAATSIGLVGKASGLAGTEAATLGVEMAKLAADISSFHNVGMEEALTTIRSGLVGEAEPLRRFGVLLSEDAVKAEALRLGLARTSGELSEQAKVRARISLIKNAPAMKPVQGDLERTADSAANQIRKLEGDIENFKTKLGEAFVGPMTEAIKLATELGTTLGAIGKDGAAPAAEWAKSWLGALRVVNASRDAVKLNAAGHTMFKGEDPLQAVADNLAGVQRGKGGGGGDVAPKGLLRGLADAMTGGGGGGGAVAGPGVDADEMKRQLRERKKAAADAYAKTPMGRLTAGRQKEADDALRERNRRAFDDSRKAWGLDPGAHDGKERKHGPTPEDLEAGKKKSGLSGAGYEAARGYTFEAYEGAQKKSGLTPEAYKDQVKRSGLTPDAYDARRKSGWTPAAIEHQGREKAEAKAAADPRKLAADLGGGLKSAAGGLGGLLSGLVPAAPGPRLSGEDAERKRSESLAKAAADLERMGKPEAARKLLAPKPVDPADEARRRRRERAEESQGRRTDRPLSGAPEKQDGLFGSMASAVKGGAAEAAGNLWKTATEPKLKGPEPLKLADSQVMGADDFARSNLTGALDNERDKQLAEQEKANTFLEKIQEGIEKMASKAGDRAGAVLRGKS